MVYLSKIMRSDLTLFGNLKTFTCPTCGKCLINLSTNENQREFWCDCDGKNYLINIID